MKHTVAWLDGDGKVRLDYRPVHMLHADRTRSQVVPPKERVY